MTKIDSVFDDTLKRCVRCEKEFPRTKENWSKNKAQKDGFNYYCKPCYRVKQKEQRAKNEKYWEANDAYDGSLKWCPQCEEELQRTKEHWGRDKSTKDGLYFCCKDCRKALAKEQHAKNKAYWETNDPFDGELKRCSHCGLEKTKVKENWYKNANISDGLQNYCAACSSSIRLKRHSKNWASALIQNCRLSSKKRDHPAPTIDENWILSQLEKQQGRCYWSNVKLELGNGNYAGHNQVSIDRLDNYKGYDPDNCLLVTWFMNRARSDMSVIEFIDHLKDLAANLDALYGQH